MGRSSMIVGILSLVLVWTASAALSALTGDLWTRLGVGIGLYLGAAPMIPLGLFLSVSGYRQARRRSSSVFSVKPSLRKIPQSGRQIWIPPLR